MTHFTTLEQSKALIEAGLNPETADCCWNISRDNCKQDPFELAKNENTLWLYPIDKIRGNLSDYMLPCWSTGALIDLLPKYIKSGKEYFDLMIVPFYNQVKYYNEKEKTYLESRMKITLLDSLVSMIERLLRCKSTYSDVSSKCLLFS